MRDWRTRAALAGCALAAQIASGSAIQIMPGAIATPAEIEAVINATTPGIGRRERGLF